MSADPGGDPLLPPVQRPGSGTLEKAQWYNSKTFYQILEVSPPTEEEEKRDAQNIVTTIVVKKRGKGSQSVLENSFDEYTLDSKTINDLEKYPREGDENKLSSYLPSPGVLFAEGFINGLSKPQSETSEIRKIEQTELANFYQPIRTILYSRKISQLIAKTWWCYLEAKKSDLWDKFKQGKWDEIINAEGVDGLYILDGLIAREIFLFGGGSPPDRIDGDPQILIRKPEGIPVEEARFIILPTSKSWQGVSLSLLLAGQVYYEIGQEYHQVSQPILSTGQIVSQYSHEVDWSRFDGEIKEIVISQEKPWIAYTVVLPYPPIPDDAKPENIKKWADAEDDGGDLPFYRKTEDDKYLIDVNYFRPPYPYIPLSCT